MKKPSVFEQVKAILLPVTVTVLIPLVILYFSKNMWSWGLGLNTVLGMLLLLGGLFLLITTVKLFVQIGKGTLAPWNPPKKLVVTGPYQYVRNPMISGVLFILLGEAIFFGSIDLFLWFVVFWALNHVYFKLFEEPELIKRFEKEYLVYRENVPKWVPRLSPWKESKETEKE